MPIKTIGNYQILKRKKLYNYKVHKNLAIMLATSGSTGNSKIAKISYQNVNENTIQISKYSPLFNKKTKTVTTLPINYTYGMSILNTFLNSKSKIYITKNNILHKDFWNIVVNKKINMISLGVLNKLIEKIYIHKKNLPYLKVFTQAGGKLSPEVLKYFQKYVKKNKNKFFCNVWSYRGHIKNVFLKSIFI